MICKLLTSILDTDLILIDGMICKSLTSILGIVGSIISLVLVVIEGFVVSISGVGTVGTSSRFRNILRRGCT